MIFLNAQKIVFLLLILFLLASPIGVMADDRIDSMEIKDIKEVMETASILSNEPKIDSKYAVVMDRDSKVVLYGKNENVKAKMASTTKIMTALVTIENTDLNSVVEISRKAAGTGGSRLKLKAGDKITVKDLLYGLLLRSGNDAAVAIAEYVAGSISAFANLMNQKAMELGLQGTHFETPHGLDTEEHYTTAYELAILTDYALKNDVFANIVKTKTYTIMISNVPRMIHNTNELLGYFHGVYGVKTGFTNGAGRCLVTSAKRDNFDIICVVLGADTKKIRTTDSIKLMEYIFQNFKKVNISVKIEQEFSKWEKDNKDKFKIEKGKNNSIYLKLGEYTLKSYPMKQNTVQNLKIKIEVPFYLKAPIKRKEPIGKMIVFDGDKEILTVEILCEKNIEKKKIGDYLLEFGKNYKKYLEETIYLPKGLDEW